ncbi:MAG TPA: ABC transporter permease [Terriglobales bacterium]|jgi:putative ABC transport system permease protein|nr:ABC transporter permease [Terriglobales bacterium]
MRFLDANKGSIVHWEESVRFAVWALAVDKVKASLTMLGVVIGSAAIVLVVTIASTGKVYMISQIEGIGSNLAYASLDRAGTTTVPEDELTPGDLSAARQALPGVRAVAGTYDLPVDLQLRGKAFHPRLVGVTQDFESIRNLRIISGRYFDRDDFLSRFKVCLITDRMVQAAFGSDPAVGNTIQVGQFRCTIIGIFTEGVPTFGQSEIQDETLLIPFPLVKDITGDNFFQVLYAQAVSPEKVATMTEQMEQLLTSRHRKGAHYLVENLSSLLQAASKIAFAMSVVLFAIAALTLITAGTGIMNIMLVNVSERTHEIGLRKALGATTSEIRQQFLLEAFFISLAGALAGVVIALILVWSVAVSTKHVLPLDIYWMAVVVALVVSSGVGVLFGYRPASEAANLNPIEALRTE